MIVQNFLNWLSVIVAGIIAPIPPLPTEMAGIVSDSESAVEQFAATAAILGPIVPYGALSAIAATFVPLVGYWGTILVVRLVAWALGR